jgi:hypothetical protein
MLLASGISGCLSFSNLQGADTVNEGRATFVLATGRQKITLVTEKEDEKTHVKSKKSNEIEWIIIEYGLRYGLKKNMDVGLKTALFGAYTGDVKYRFHQSQSWSLATGLGASTATLATLGGSYKTLDFLLPFFIQYNLTPTTHLYAVPKVTSRRTSYVGDSYKDSKSDVLVGSTFGLAFGHDFQGFAEYSIFKGNRPDDKGVRQVMLGINFGAGNLDRYQGEGRKMQTQSPRERRIQ